MSVHGFKQVHGEQRAWKAKESTSNPKTQTCKDRLEYIAINSKGTKRKWELG